MKSIEFDQLPAETKHTFNEFFSNIQQGIQAQPPPIPEAIAPRVTYQIKGSAGPTASAEILGKAGVNVTPEIMTEKPLETWITDSADKPNVQETGNMPADENAELMNQASLAQKMAQAEQMHAHSMQQNEQQSSQTEIQNELQTHQQHSKLRQEYVKEQALKQNMMLKQQAAQQKQAKSNAD